MAQGVRGLLAIPMVSSVPLSGAVDPPIALVGRGFVAGNLLDKSGLTGNICQVRNAGNCVPKAIFGGFGSAHRLHRSR